MLSFFVLILIFIFVIKLFKYTFIETAYNTINHKDVSENIIMNINRLNFDIFFTVFYLCIFILLMMLAFIELLRKKR
jgi:hypothetical protein